MPEEAVRFEVLEEGIGLLTLNRPEQYNAINQDMVDGALSVFQRLESSGSVSVLVITGAGKAFCAGGDVDWLLQARDNQGKRAILEKAEALILELDRITIPVIAGVNGVAAGAGTALALACDLVVGSKMATFAPNFVSIGAVPDSGASWFLPRRIGRQKAMELLLTGKRLSADEALEQGLYNSVLPVDCFRQEVLRLAGEIASGPKRALGWTKKLVRLSGSNTLEAQLEAEASLQMMAWSDDDFQEGVQAFRDGRRPRFGSGP